jgi:arylsulfatase A
MPTVADIIGFSLPDDAAVDGFSFKDAFFGRKPEKTRPAVVHHSIRWKICDRNGKWKLVLCPGSGGWSDPRDEKAKEMGFPDIQLYDMQNDIEEQHNLQAKHPEVVRKLWEC